jgi:hypothetical protein
MRARLRVSACPLGGGRYRPGGDAQAAMERWWAELARVFARDGLPPGHGGAAGPPRPHVREERGEA